jgi:hypothetical protein
VCSFGGVIPYNRIPDSLCRIFEINIMSRSAKGQK